MNWYAYSDINTVTTGDCATAVSWGTKPYSTATGHEELKCSGVGICDHLLGTCTCPSGFSGQACERMDCPYNCNGHGACMSLKNVGLIYGPDTSAGFSPGGDGLGPDYTNWDSSSVAICICDHGYNGPDCRYSEFGRP